MRSADFTLLLTALLSTTACESKSDGGAGTGADTAADTGSGGDGGGGGGDGGDGGGDGGGGDNFMGPSCDLRVVQSGCWEFVGSIYGSTEDTDPVNICADESGIYQAASACDESGAVGRCYYFEGSVSETRYVFYAAASKESDGYDLETAQLACDVANGRFVELGG